MSMLSDWQAAIEEYDVETEAIEHFSLGTGIIPEHRRPEPDWQTIARQALKVALAAEAYVTPPFDSKNTLPALIDALKGLEE